MTTEQTAPRIRAGDIFSPKPLPTDEEWAAHVASIVAMFDGDQTYAPTRPVVDMSDERWVCAWADYERGRVSWLGFPRGDMKLSDVLLRESCSEEQHLKTVSDILDRHQNWAATDSWTRTVARLYRPEEYRKQVIAERTKQIEGLQEQLARLWQEQAADGVPAPVVFEGVTEEHHDGIEWWGLQHGDTSKGEDDLSCDAAWLGRYPVGTQLRLTVEVMPLKDLPA